MGGVKTFRESIKSDSRKRDDNVTANNLRKGRKMKRITDRQMARYWARRVSQLEAMRPMTAVEAATEADELEAQAAELEMAVKAAEACPRETGRVANGDTVSARDMRNVQALGSARAAVWGFTTIAGQLRDRAAALRKIAAEPPGDALAASIDVARRRAWHYADLAARSANS